jgi:type IX secretion system PorP/SprF family membrane protein
MANRLTLCLLFSCFWINQTYAQQLPLLTYYREHHALINPATLYYERYTSENQPNLSAGLSFRRQWVGVADAPRTMTGRFEHILPDKNMLYGISLMNDAIGLSEITGGQLRYAYQIKFEQYENSQLSIGINMGFFQYRYKPWNGTLRQANDATGLNQSKQGIFDFSAGVFWSGELGNKDVLYGGASVPQLLAKSFSFDNSPATSRYQHYYVVFGYYHFFQGGDLSSKSFIEPSLWLRYVPYIPLQMDANIRVNIDKMWVGAGVAASVEPKFRLDIMHAEMGFRLPLGGDYNTLKIGYGFDITTNNAAVKLGSTHEINLVYSWAR